MSFSVLPRFSSKSYIVSGLNRSLIHFEFIFVYCVRKCSNFILLHVAVQFSWHHLLKRLFLPPLYIIVSFVKHKVPIGALIYFWAFYFVPLVYVSVFVPVSYCLDDCSVQFTSDAQSCPTLCDPMNHSTPGLPVHHQLPEFTQTHVHRVGNAI